MVMASEPGKDLDVYRVFLGVLVAKGRIYTLSLSAPLYQKGSLKTDLKRAIPSNPVSMPVLFKKDFFFDRHKIHPYRKLVNQKVNCSACEAAL